MEVYGEVRGFFRELLLSAMGNLRIRTQEPTEHYLVNLLAGYAAVAGQDLAPTFVEQLGQALQMSGQERWTRMRLLGDDALFVAGWLQDSCARRGVTTTYCVTIGTRAYQEAGRAGTGASEVFRDLSHRFLQYSHVLDEVREQTSMATNLVQLYERWTETQSPEALKRLQRRGVFPLKSSSGH